MRSPLRRSGFVPVSLFALAATTGLACSSNAPPDGSGGAGVGGTAAGGSNAGGGSSGGSGSGGEPAAGGAPSGGAMSGGAGGAAAGGTTTGGQGASGGSGASGGAPAGGSAGAGGEGTTGGAGGADFDCNTGTLTTRLPCKLSQTGLFEADMQTLAAGVHTFAPQFPLWTDGADKHRWIALPAGEKIDTTNMDYWSFPVGTKLWKDFWRDGKRIETRLNEKRQSGSWSTVAYLWLDDQSDAHAVPDGQLNASGTEHDVPNSDQCWNCHSQQTDKILGFSAVQLSHAGEDPNDANEWTLAKLIAADLLTAPPAAPLEFSAGWSEEEKKTFGYLHANCGTCHNPVGSANNVTGLDLWLKVADLALNAEESSVYLGAVDQDIVKLDVSLAATKRIESGNLDNSAIYQRFIAKGQEWSMPTLGTEIVDPEGKQLLEDFINGLP